MACNPQPLLTQVSMSIPDFTDYQNKLYTLFEDNYINNNIYFNGIKIIFKSHPQVNSKSETFWHITSTKDSSGNRLPDFARYHTIMWIKYITDICVTNASICSKIWMKKQNGRNRVLIMCDSINYLVVLEDRKSYYLFVTAYPVNRSHTKNKLLNEYTKCKNRLH